MKIKDMIAELQRIAEQDLKGGDAEVILFDRSEEMPYSLNADLGLFQYEITRGDGEAVIEFN